MPDPPGPPGPERRLIIGGAPTDTTATDADRERRWSDVPWRTIVASVGVVLATYIVIQIVLLSVEVIAWIFVAGFFALVLAPAVRRVQARVGGRRGVATGIVVFTTLAVVVGVLSLFLVPVRSQLIAILTDLPGTVRDAANGRGAVGRLVTRLHLNNYVQDHEAELRDAADRLNSSSFELVSTLLSGVTAFFMLSQSTTLGNAAMSLVPARRRDSVKRVALDSAGAISGYMVGNLLISLIAGTAAFGLLLVLGVPSPFVLAM